MSISVNHNIQWLSQEITVVWVETFLSGSFMSSEKIHCSSLLVVFTEVTEHIQPVCSILQTFREVEGTASLSPGKNTPDLSL